jgi:hypothetical protein
MTTRFLLRSPFRALGTALLLAALALTGCRASVATVSGTVTYRGKPVTSGTVVFVGEDHRVSLPAPIQADGTYTARRVPVGSVKVVVDNPRPVFIGRSSGGPRPTVDDPEVTANREVAAHYVPTPPKYRDPDQSGITLEVHGGTNPFDITLP